MRGTVKSCKKPEDKTHYLLVIDIGEPKPMFFNLHPKHNTEMYKVVRDTGIKWKDEVEFEYDDDGQWTVLTSLEKVGDAPKTAAALPESGGHSPRPEDSARQLTIQRQAIVKDASSQWANILLAMGTHSAHVLFETFRIMEAFDRWCSGGDLEYIPTEPEQEEKEDA
jgi:hypothetical protein